MVGKIASYILNFNVIKTVFVKHAAGGVSAGYTAPCKLI